MKTTIQSVKGTRDFYPLEMAQRQWLYRMIREVSEEHGYQEWEGPIIEAIGLYSAKSSDELVKKQAFVFNDRGGSEIVLRPELTPSFARMVAQKQQELVYPLRWWQFGPFWRYETPQKGRTREFFQWNIDMIGINHPAVDAELIAVAAAFFKKVGLTPQQVQIRVNNRRLMNNVLAEMGIADSIRAETTRLIDRRDKLTPDQWRQNVFELGVTSSQHEQLMGVLCDHDLWKKSDELVATFDVLDAMGVKEYVSYDPTIIRGLDYYTGTVFEAYDVVEKGRALLGGGRYDNLLAAVGGDPLSAIGFAMGDVGISLVLGRYGLLPQQPPYPAKVLVTVFDEQRITSSHKLSAEIRRAGINATCYPEAAKLPKQLKYADRVGVKVVLIQGPDEEENGFVAIKNLATHEQVSVRVNLVIETIKRMLAEA
jgi:histidyl-tRNA synthetase